MVKRLKTCSRCHNIKPLDEFSRNNARKDGRQFYCKPCAREIANEYRTPERTRHHQQIYKERHRDRINAKARAKYRANKDLWRDRAYQTKYGITLAQYDEMLEAQGGVCAICSDPPSRMHLSVDHDHETNEIRGLLCDGCNKGIGCLKDDQQVLLKAARYLEAHKTIPT